MANMQPGGSTGRPFGRLLLAAPSLGDATGRLAKELADRGVQVSRADTPEQALRQAAHVSFDLVICDLALPQTSGLNLLRELRAREVQIPAFLLCGPEQPLLEAAELDAFCLQQPVEIGCLLNAALPRLLRHVPQPRRMYRSIPRDTADAVAATAAKNKFGELLGTAMRGGRVVITKHDLPSAVLISYGEYRELTREDSPNLEALTREFDALLDRMQTPTAHAATEALFRASPADLSEAAQAEARDNPRSPQRG